VRRVRATTASAPAGRAFAVIAYVPMAVSADGREARARVRPLLARYLAALHGQSILADAGLEPARTQPLRNAWLAGTPAADLVTDEMVDALAVAGTPDECRRALGRLAEAGLDAPVAVLPAGPPLAEQLAQLGNTLAPAWRELAVRTPRRRTA
jgi:5,10-methylenetetrahydromethanopterin reductase